MAAILVDVMKLDNIIKRTIDAINTSKAEIYDIAENARKEYKRLEKELEEIKQKVSIIIREVEYLNKRLMDSKKRLMEVSKNFTNYSQDEIREAYNNADNLRVEFAVKKEQEQNLIKRRNEVEVRLRESYQTVEKAEKLISNVGMAMSYLTGDLMTISEQLEDMNQRQSLGIKIMKAQEEERQRIAREIHDGPAQLLSNIVLKAEISERLLDVDVAKAKDELQQLKQVVRFTLQDIRKIIYNLRPMSLDDLGLVPTIQRFASAFEDDTGIAVEVRVLGAVYHVEPIISLALYRIAQEAFSNISKHSKAKSVSFNLEFTDKFIRMNVTDDGIGFDPDAIKYRNANVDGGFGLLNMRERIELLNGEFSIKSEIGKGTRINIAVPAAKDRGINNE